MPIINGSDPGISNQNSTPLVARTAPPTISSNGAASSTGSTIARGIAPIVSGSDVTYPQATESTSSNSVTITSSVNNDSGDVVTVYTSPSTITVSSINQTVNQYTAVDSGVSQIVAGNGVTITSTGNNGTGIVTINAASASIGNIAVLNLDGNSTNVLHGDGTWSADITDYGNSNVANYLPTYTGNITGDYMVLTHDANANVVYANYLYGDGSNITNVPASNPFNQELNTTDNVQFANVTSTDAIRFSNSGNIVGALGYAPTFVSIESYGSNTVQITSNDSHTWSFGNTGVLSKSDANGLVLAANYSAQIITDYGDNDRTWTFDGTSGELVLPGGNVLIDPTDDNFEVRGAQNVNFEANAVVNIYTDTSNAAYQWQFGDDGNLTAPGSINTTVGLSTLVFGKATATGNPGMSSTSSITLSANRGGTVKSIFLGTDGDTSFPGNITATNIGNISAINLDGNASNVLRGDGTFSADIGSASGANGEVQFSMGGLLSSTGNFTFTNGVDGGVIELGSASALQLIGNGTVQNPAGNIVVTANSASWRFYDDGNLLVSGNIRCANSFNVGTANSYTYYDQTTGGTELVGAGNVWIYANTAQYNFGTNGTLQTQSAFTLESAAGNINFGISSNANSNVRFANVGVFVSSNVTANGGGFTLNHANSAQGTITLADGTANSFVVQVGTGLSTWAGAGSLNMITSSSPGANIGFFVAQNEAGRFTTTGLSVTGNITADNLGNIISVDLDGSSSNILYGNGVFAAAPASTYGDSNVASLLGSFGSNTISTTGNVAAGAVTASGKIGYSAGNTVTQTTSRASGVTLNALSGEITLFASSMSAGQVDFFTMTNNQLEAGDMIICTTYGGSLGTYLPMAYVTSATQAVFTFRNLDSFVTAAETPIIKFIVIKAPNA